MRNEFLHPTAIILAFLRATDAPTAVSLRNSLRLIVLSREPISLPSKNAVISFLSQIL